MIIINLILGSKWHKGKQKKVEKLKEINAISQMFERR